MRATANTHVAGVVARLSLDSKLAHFRLAWDLTGLEGTIDKAKIEYLNLVS